MGTQLIFTVGTNPLPIWVAWHHLKDKLQPPVQVRFVHTAGTETKKERLEKYCHGACFLDPIQTSEGNPKSVRDAIRPVASLADTKLLNVHVHYTGGTKVMGVETVAALEASLPERIHLDTSYLDPRARSGPVIVNRAGNNWVNDTRKGIDPDLCRIALLNGFMIGPFESKYWSWENRCWETQDCPAPGKPTQEELKWGMDALRRGRCKDPIHLEYGAYATLQKALGQISNRTNYQLFHSVHARRAGAKDQRVRHFELDVVAVLGYQIVVVSCTTAFDPSMVKQKAMEAYHRARQLGGDEARAGVLCANFRDDEINLIQEELQDETGSSDLPLQIWGRNTWKNLSSKFERYLCNDLHWR